MSEPQSEASEEPGTAIKRVEGHLRGELALALYWRAWLPTAQPRAVVAIAHGVFEHSGRYAHVAERLARAGFAIYALDHRGHGRSEGRRGNIGRMAHLVADLDKLVLLIGHRHPGRGIFLLGHSMGGAIALQYAFQRQGTLAGLILSAPAVDVSGVSSLQVAIAKLLSAIAPKLGILTVDSSKISRDPAVVRAYNEDPLVYRGKAPVRTIADVITTAQQFCGRAHQLTLPLLVMHGTGDSLVAVAGSRIVHDRARCADKTLNLYEGLYHEVLNEPEKDCVIGDLLDWLVERS
jgi:acylglycerol lipase